ncbi:MAG: hypothetical protein ONB46_10685 [candidate division KSB1 bacterium]|nr:hypothetical protein [candidate division KSB1 bacterium]MDZ7366271.1 hypothetical protein [candidate division KSB1 bacterium]MDZ7404489.1 hypothetical protein [candidate division KSB1 bacterium]
MEASQILLKTQKPIEAASRAYYAAYQMVTAVLIKVNLSPRSDLWKVLRRFSLTSAYSSPIPQRSFAPSNFNFHRPKSFDFLGEFLSLFVSIYL